MSEEQLSTPPPPPPDATTSTSSTNDAEEKKKKDKGPSKAELKKMEKERKRLEREKAEAEKRAAELQALGEEVLSRFQDAPLIQSTEISGRVWTPVKALSMEMQGQRVLIRGRLHTSRSVGKGVFVMIRDGTDSVQAVMFQSEEKKIPKQMIKYAVSIGKESVIEISGIVTIPEEPVTAATISSI